MILGKIILKLGSFMFVIRHPQYIPYLISSKIFVLYILIQRLLKPSIMIFEFGVIDINFDDTLTFAHITAPRKLECAKEFYRPCSEHRHLKRTNEYLNIHSVGSERLCKHKVLFNGTSTEVGI